MDSDDSNAVDFAEFAGALYPDLDEVSLFCGRPIERRLSGGVARKRGIWWKGRGRRRGGTG